MENAKYVIAFREAVNECKKEAEAFFGNKLPEQTNFDVSKCIEQDVNEISEILKQKFINGAHDGRYESFVPVSRALWHDGLPPKTIMMKVERIQWGSTVIGISISREQSNRSELPVFKVFNDYTNKTLPIDDF